MGEEVLFTTLASQHLGSIVQRFLNPDKIGTPKIVTPAKAGAGK